MSRKFPFTIANEIVSAQVGAMLGLNVPSVLSHRVDGGNEYALITWHRSVPKTASAIEEYVNANSDEVHGAIVFDLFIANNDRAFAPERRNIAFDDSDRLFLYDQGNACFYRNRASEGISAGIPRLEALESDIAAMFDMAHKGNFYFQLLTQWPLVEKWCERIRSLPDFTLEAAVNRIPRFLSRPTVDERGKLVEFLTARRGYLIDHIIKRRDLFSGLPDRNGNACLPIQPNPLRA